MASREEMGSVQGVLSARDGSVYGALCWKRLEGVGGALGMALWSQFSGVVEESRRALSQRSEAWVQSTSNVFVARPEGSGGRVC
jgi:hypothetical protein